MLIMLHSIVGLCGNDQQATDLINKTKQHSETVRALDREAEQKKFLVSVDVVATGEGSSYDADELTLTMVQPNGAPGVGSGGRITVDLASILRIDVISLDDAKDGIPHQPYPHLQSIEAQLVHEAAHALNGVRGTRGRGDRPPRILTFGPNVDPDEYDSVKAENDYNQAVGVKHFRYKY